MSTRTPHPKLTSYAEKLLAGKRPHQSLGERIRNARVSKDLSQRGLAHSIGHEGEDAGAYISRVESGVTVPRIDTLKKIAEVLDLDLGELVQ